MGSLVSTHNTKLLMKDDPKPVQGCNCRGGPTNCPLPTQDCQKDKVIYVASVSTQDSTEHYTGLTGGTFKKRWYKHNNEDFEKRENENNTRLSAYIWKLKDEGKPFDVKWEIMDRATTFNHINRKCRLCLKEIYYIMFKPESASLNLRKELFNTCRHRTQKLLSEYKEWKHFFLVLSFPNNQVNHNIQPLLKIVIIISYETNL